MALKLRRGTEANRTSITPAEGELIYVTDTKKLYSGDGTTAGGVLVTGGGGADIPGIDDNTTAGAVLTLGDLVIAIDADLSITGYEINGDGDIDITGNITASGAGTGIITASSFVGDVTGNLVGNTSGVHTGTFDGDMTGSVFVDDSTKIIDGLTGTISAANGIEYSNIVNISQTQANELAVASFNNTGEAQYIKIKRTDTGTAPDQNVGLLSWDQVDDTGTKTYVSFAGWHSGLYIGTASDGTTYNPTNYVGITDGNMALGDYTPAAGYRLDVRGNAIVSGNFEAAAFTLTGSNIDTSDSSAITITPAVTMSSDLVVENDVRVSNIVYAESFVSNSTGTPQITAATNLDLTAGNAVQITSSVLRLASFTTTERNALAGQNGDIIYNTTDNKFQGYENGAWANLI